jgi:hypothetical protein
VVIQVLTWTAVARARTVLPVAALAFGVALGPAARAAGQQPPGAAAEKPLDSGLREALQQYATALESLDAEAVKKIQPSIDVEGLKRAFREMRALDVDIDNIRLLSSDASSARVSCRVEQTLTPKAGSRQTTTVTRVLRLRRQDAGWIIQAFER